MWVVAAPKINKEPKHGVVELFLFWIPCHVFHFRHKAKIEDKMFQWLHIQADANRDGKIQYGEFVRWLFSEGGGQATPHAVLKVNILGSL